MSDARGASWGPDMRDHTHWLGPRPEMIAGERLALGDALERGPDGRAYRYRDRSRPPAAGAHASAEAGGKVPIAGPAPEPRPTFLAVDAFAILQAAPPVLGPRGGGPPPIALDDAEDAPEADPPGETWRDRPGLL